MRKKESLVVSTLKSVFGIVVEVAFQIAFRAEMHSNDVFLFFKNYFWHQHIKTIQKVQTALNFSKKKKFKIWWKAVKTRDPCYHIRSTTNRKTTKLNPQQIKHWRMKLEKKIKQKIVIKIMSVKIKKN